VVIGSQASINASPIRSKACSLEVLDPCLTDTILGGGVDAVPRSGAKYPYRAALVKVLLSLSAREGFAEFGL
jgi:hypothetical protein